METKRILIKLLGIMLLGIIVLGCTKKNQAGIENDQQAAAQAAAALEAEALRQTETISAQETLNPYGEIPFDPDFDIEGTTLVKYNDNGNGENVIIPSSVTVIGERAFRGSGLTSITIPSSVITIGDYAFAYSKSLVSVTIPSSVTTIGEGAFCYCESLTSVDIPSSVTSIGEEAFFESVLTSVTLSRITDFVKEGDTASFPSYVQINYRD